MLPWVVPFGLYMVILSTASLLPLSPEWNHVLRLAVVAPILFVCSRRHFRLRPTQPIGSLLVGIAVFLVWVVPDALFPGYRHHVLFSNALLGEYSPDAGISATSGPLFLLLRVAVSVMMVPIIEELFWRGFLMRVLIRGDFSAVPMGTWHREAFWITAVLFAFEHGSHWDVGLVAGIAYNAWLIRTRALSDVIFAHAVTNGLLAAYVILLGKWEFWP